MSVQFQNQGQMTNQQSFEDSANNIEKDNDNLDSSFSNSVSNLSSNNNSASINSNSNNNSDVCRDFLRNTCRRGTNCKFSHPEKSDPNKKGDIPLLTFCHDFQNRECRRNNCKFVHCSKQDEETYKRTGKLPPQVNYQTSNNNSNSNSNTKFNSKKSFNNSNQSNNSNYKDVPICKDFVKDDCFRGSRCKFRHVKNDLQDRSFNNSINSNSNNINNNKVSFNNGQFDNRPLNGDNNNGRFMMQHPHYDQLNSNQLKSNSAYDNTQYPPLDNRRNMRSIYEPGPEPKRRAFDNGFNAPTTFTFANNTNNQLCVTNALNHQLHSNQNSAANASNSADTNSTDANNQLCVAAAAAAVAIKEYNLSDTRFLYEENNNLRRKIDELKQQVVDLMNANSFLLEQNSQLRNSLLPSTSVSQKLNQVSTTLHNSLAANPVLHACNAASNSVVQPAPPPNNPHIGASTISNTADLLVAANHLHRQNTLQNQQARAVVASATSSALSSMSSNPLTSNPLSSNPLTTNPLSATSSISLTSTSTSTPLVSYPIMSSSLPINSLGHLTH